MVYPLILKIGNFPVDEGDAYQLTANPAFGTGWQSNAVFFKKAIDNTNLLTAIRFFTIGGQFSVSQNAAFLNGFHRIFQSCIGFLFIAMSYGFLMRSRGFSVFYPMAMSAFIFAGSMEFVAVELLLSAYAPLHAFLLTLMVNARHLFYGISMLEKYKGMGWKKPYLIFGMCDETFSINCTVPPPEGVDRGWFMFFVTLLNQTYWVAGATLGALLGSVLHFDTTGIEFVMTALFTVMFVNQWEEAKDHRPALTGLGCAALCLTVFGSDGFMLPAMALIIVCFLVSSKSQKKGEPAL